MNAALKITDLNPAPPLKEAMRLVAGGVSVITAGVGEERTGLTVTSAISLSIDPPTMIVCVNRNASAMPAIEKHRHFCVNVLTAEHQHVADRFAGRGGEKGAARYEQAEWRPHVTGALALEGALVSIDCEVEELVERHSHVIVIGSVRAVTTRAGRPLVYAEGRYQSLAEP
jgi:3-hydroxy-9,10-secoandrosta-1,3,5(10)-triene-9,17-dione monooxygenase reductase component